MSNELLKKAERCFLHVGILVELSKGKKITGYDILIRMREFGFKVSPGTVYHRLDVLARHGIVKEEKQPWGKNYKTVYEMTERGKELFQEFKRLWKKPLEYAIRNLK